MPARRILYLSRWYPFPPDNGARLRVSVGLRALARRFDVTLISFIGSDQTRRVADEAECERVVTVPYLGFRPNGARARLAYLSPRPRSLVDTDSPAIREAVEAEVRRGDVAAAVVSTLEMTPYLSALGTVPAVLDDLELGCLIEPPGESTWAARLRARASWLKLSRYLRSELPRYSVCCTVSSMERDLVTGVLPGADVEVVENSIDVQACAAVTAIRRPHHLIFNGSPTYRPNREAMEWFCGRVLPRIRAALPDVELTISGRPSPEPFPAAAGVHFSGHVEDIRALVASAAVCVAPIRSGGGTRLKVIEAMALGTAVVATSKCVEGLAAVHDRHFLLAEEEETFAVQVLRLLRDDELRRRLTLAARALVAEHYDAERVGTKFLHLVERAAAARSL